MSQLVLTALGMAEVLSEDQIGKIVDAFNTVDTDKDGKTGTDRDLRNVIVRGALVFGGSQMMGPTKGLSDEEAVL